MDYWKPNTTVAAVVERDGRFLLVEEQTRDGLRLNQPAGHLDPGESLLQAVVRETLEETAYEVEPVALIGVYMSRYLSAGAGRDVTYLRFTFECKVVRHHVERELDTGIQRALWMNPIELRAQADRHRSAAVIRSVNDYVRGKRYPLELIYTDSSCMFQYV
jgi:8-oxo-dGTP pyrophosphatase MutT (NUDIX family)